ncbi:hypothetical protein RCL1_008992 [Eukaryota sp. TZLM3-RCL]
MSITLSRTCLFRTLSLVLSSSIQSLSLRFGPIESIFSLLSKFGNVSESFRVISLQVVQDIFSSLDPELHLSPYSHSFSLLQKLFPTQSFSIIVDVNTSHDHHDSLKVHALKLCFGEPNDFNYFNNFNSLNHSLKFIESLSTIKRLSLDTCEFNNNLLSQISEKMPYLTSLCFSGCFNKILYFPTDFQNLNELLIDFSVISIDDDVLDVSNLINLTNFSLVSEGSVNVIGLDKLSKLSILEFQGVCCYESLHPSAGLSILQLSFENLSEYLPNIFATTHQFDNCEFSVSSFTDNSLKYFQNFKSKISTINSVFHYNKPGSFSSLEFPNLKTLDISTTTKFSLDLTNSLKLNKLYLEVSFSRQRQIQLSEIMFLSELILISVDPVTLSQFLTTCPYLERLEVDGFKHDCEDVDFSKISLNYLKYWKLSNSEFLNISRLQRLHTLVADNVCFFPLDYLSNLPNLTTLDLFNCEFEDISLKENHNSLKRLQIIVLDHCPPDFTFFSKFSCLDYLFLDLKSDYHYKGTLNLPPKLVYFCYFGPFSAIKSSLNSLNSLELISGEFLIGLSETMETAEDWLVNYKHVHSSSLVEIVFSCKIY